jgi:hypothetical protein
MRRYVQGAVLGLFIFAAIVLIGAFYYSYFVFSDARATGTTAITGLTLDNWMFWLALVVSLVAGLMIARRWPKVQH